MSHASPRTCLSDAELVELVESQLDGAALARLNEHVAGCSTCAGLVAGLGSTESRAVRPAESGVDVQWARDIVAEESASSLGSIVAKSALVPASARIAGRFIIE